MSTATIKRILTSEHPTLRGHYLYVAEVKKTVLYVGQAQSPRDRLQEHLGLVWGRSSSHLGMVILANLPSSLAWRMRFFTLEDCRPAVSKAFRSLNLAWYNTPACFQDSVDFAERALISRFKPCFNQIACPENSPVPKGIRTEPVLVEVAHRVLKKLLRREKANLPESAFVRHLMDEEIQRNAL